MSALGVAFDFAIRPVDADFGGKDNALPATALAQGFAHDLFGTPVAVDGRSVDKVDALVEGGMNGTNGLLLVGSAPHPATDGPGAECDSGTNEVRTVNFDVFQHDCPSRCLVRDRYIFLAQPTLDWRFAQLNKSTLAKSTPDHVCTLPLGPKCACFSICRITAEKSCSAPSSDCLALISKAAPAAGIRAPTAAARLRINPKSLFISRIGNCGL